MTMKSALITGAASGIGKACAQRMAKEGYGVVVADVNLPAAEALVQELTAAGGLYARMWADYNKAVQWKITSEQ